MFVTRRIISVIILILLIGCLSNTNESNPKSTGDKVVIRNFHLTVPCDLCKKTTVVVNKVVNDYDGRVELISVDVQRDPIAVAKFGVKYVPYVTVGELPDYIVVNFKGNMTLFEENLRNAIEKTLRKEK